jgi:hypothetical protein
MILVGTDHPCLRVGCHTRRFGDKATQQQAAKIAKMHGGRTLLNSPAAKPSMIDSPRPPSAKKGAYGTSASIQQPTDQSVADKEVSADLNNPEKKFRVSRGFDPKLELMLITFLWKNLDVFT